MSMKLYDLKMNEIKMRGVKWLELIPEPPQSERITESVWDGDITLGKKRISRQLTARFFYRADGRTDYKVLRDELFAILDPMRDFYAIDTDIPGRKWRVDIDSQTLKRVNTVAGEWEVNFYSAKTYAYSIYSTLESSMYKSTMLLLSLGLKGGSSVEDYVRKTTSFSIYNAGNCKVDPRAHQLKIILKSLTATSSDLKITNTSTGDVWNYKGPFQAGDTILLDGVQSKRNGLNVVYLTAPNYGLITMAPGINNFIITGLTGTFEISFDFPFLYV